MNRKYPFKVVLFESGLDKGCIWHTDVLSLLINNSFQPYTLCPFFSMPLTCCRNWVSCPAECPTFWIYLFSCVIIVFPNHLNFLKLEINSGVLIRLKLNLFRWECCVSHFTTIGKGSFIYLK